MTLYAQSELTELKPSYDVFFYCKSVETMFFGRSNYHQYYHIFLHSMVKNDCNETIENLWLP